MRYNLHNLLKKHGCGSKRNTKEQTVCTENLKKPKHLAFVLALVLIIWSPSTLLANMISYSTNGGVYSTKEVTKPNKTDGQYVSTKGPFALNDINEGTIYVKASVQSSFNAELPANDFFVGSSGQPYENCQELFWGPPIDSSSFDLDQAALFPPDQVTASSVQKSYSIERPAPYHPPTMQQPHNVPGEPSTFWYLFLGGLSLVFRRPVRKALRNYKNRKQPVKCLKHSFKTGDLPKHSRHSKNKYKYLGGLRWRQKEQCDFLQASKTIPNDDDVC